MIPIRWEYSDTHISTEIADKIGESEVLILPRRKDGFYEI